MGKHREIIGGVSMNRIKENLMFYHNAGFEKQWIYRFKMGMEPVLSKGDMLMEISFSHMN